ENGRHVRMRILGCILFAVVSTAIGSLTTFAQNSAADQAAEVPFLFNVGDFDGDGRLDSDDVDLLTQSGELPYLPMAEEAVYDLDKDGWVTFDDVDQLVTSIQIDTGTDLLRTVDFCVTGDINFDGVVDMDDYNHWWVCLDFSTRFPHLWIFKYTHGDMTGDGIVDYTDFDLICQNWSPGNTEECPPPPPPPTP
ncbi:MAG: EF-hand domain-containing protein, partial [Planctomycetota bacterium]